MNRVAKWNGTEWSPLGVGTDGKVYALAVSGSDVYAAGSFTQAGGAAANNVAKWNGTAWSVLGTVANNGTNGEVYALAVSGSDVYVGGFINTVGGSVTAWYVARWNGTAWSAMGTATGTNNIVYALSASGSNVYAGGRLPKSVVLMRIR